MTIEKVAQVLVAHLDPDYSGLAEEHLLRTQQQLLDLIDQTDKPRIVLDFGSTAYFASTFLEVMFRVWHRVNRRHGRLALAALQPYCLEILQTAKLNTLWPIYPTLDEAIKALTAPAPEPTAV